MTAHLRRLRKLILTAAAIGLLLLAWGCLQDGGGSDTETLTAVVLRADGSPAANAEVKLVPADYDPATPAPERIRTVRADARGRYRFPEGPAGTYNLLAASPGWAGGAGGAEAGSHEAAFAPGVDPGNLPDTLRLAKARVLFISLHGDTYALADSGKAWFPGTDILARCDGLAATVLETVPRELNSMVIESRAGWRHAFELAAPGDSLIIRATRLGVESEPY